MEKSKHLKPYLNESIDDIEGEIWKDVPMYDGRLVASNYGRIKRLGYYDSIGRYRKDKIIKQYIKKGDIPFLSITYDRKTFTMLQLVGLAFYGFLKDGFCFQRKDYDQFNCMADNILILTIEQSRQRMYDIGANVHEKHSKAALKTSRYIFKRLIDGKEYLTAEIKNDYPKQAFRVIKTAIKKGRMAYGTFWEQRERER